MTLPAVSQSLESGGKPAGSVLTPRQYEVVRRFALGQSGRSIARDLHISAETVWRHRTDALERYEAASINDLWTALGWLRVP